MESNLLDMSGVNKSGCLTRSNLEWGGKSRKEEDRLRGLNNRGRRQNIEEQVSDWYEVEIPFEYDEE